VYATGRSTGSLTAHGQNAVVLGGLVDRCKGKWCQAALQEEECGRERKAK
jgi:hypothetical protein